MIPLFKTHYSIGKSILTFEDKVEENGADSVLQIAEENKLDKLVIVEDNFHGFLKMKKACEEKNIQLIYGIRLSTCDAYDQEKSHKIIVFGADDDGIVALYKIYSHAFCEHEGRITLDELKDFWCDGLMMALPFYDSFIYYNNFTFDSFVPNLGWVKEMTCFLEDNGLPYEKLLRNKVEAFAEANGYDTQEAKSIYYKNKKDFKAWQTFKIIANRKPGKPSCLSRPNLEDCCSDEFSWESYLEKNEISV